MSIKYFIYRISKLLQREKEEEVDINQFPKELFFSKWVSFKTTSSIEIQLSGKVSIEDFRSSTDGEIELGVYELVKTIRVRYPAEVINEES